MQARRILTVDDSAAMRHMVSLTLTAAGYEVLQAANGREALRIAAEHPVDLVITDVNMPQMDGIALVRELRHLSHYRHRPLLFLTTENTPECKLEARNAGATGWMIKPFNSERLVATIARVLK